MEGGRAPEAEPIERETLQIRKRILPPDDTDTLDSIGTLGQILMYCGKYFEGEAYLREALAGYQRIGQGDKQNGIICVKEIAMCRLQQGDITSATNGLEQVTLLAITNLGPDHMITLHVQRVLARALAESGQLDEAEALCEKTLEARLHSKARQEAYGTARTLLTLGSVLVQKGKLDEAQTMLEEALKFFRGDPVCKPRPELAAQAAHWLGAIQLARKNYSEAERLLLTGSDQLFSPAADIIPNERRLSVGHIVSLYQALENPERIAFWQKKLDSLPPGDNNR
jgi:tetratricopeptide (TPR) repeat protein